jgi:hypothetical protein
MNFVFEANYPHSSRGSLAQPLLSPPEYSSPTLDRICQVLLGHWPLQDINAHVRIDNALSEWQLAFQAEMKHLAASGLECWPGVDFDNLNRLLEVWLKVVKKMEFYRLEGDFKQLSFHPHGLYQIYNHGNLKSIYLLSEIEKYRPLEEGSNFSQLQAEEQASIFRDVCLKIGRHVLVELKGEMYQPGQELMMKILKVYGFNYDSTISFANNYRQALKDKQITSENSREATIIMFTLKIVYGIQSLEGLCFYLGYSKSVLLDRSSGMLAA